jgi:hypothetical protein
MSDFLQIGLRERPLNTLALNRELTISFEEYVKCEIHLPGLTQIYTDRDVYEYKRAYEYLFKGYDKYLLDCSKVLKYFYEDLTNVFCNVLRQNPLIETNFSIDCQVRRETKMLYKSISLPEVVRDLRGALEEGRELPDDSIAGSILAKFDYEELGKLKPTALLALSSVLYYYSKSSEDIYLIEVIG